MSAWPPPDGLFATRWPDIREPGDDRPHLCCAAPWVSPLHAPDCPERCPHCGSEGGDNDHRKGCPTLGTCAQCYSDIPADEWHAEDEWGDVGLIDHMAEHHPEVAP